MVSTVGSWVYIIWLGNGDRGLQIRLKKISFISHIPSGPTVETVGYMLEMPGEHG
jgi:hypothetical protein